LILELGIGLLWNKHSGSGGAVSAVFRSIKRHLLTIDSHFYKTTQFFAGEVFWRCGAKKLVQESDKAITVDQKDKVILSQLTKNSRLTSVELARILDLTPVAVSNRIAKLERSGYITGYSVYVNVHKLGMYLFIFFHPK